MYICVALIHDYNPSPLSVRTGRLGVSGVPTFRCLHAISAARHVHTLFPRIDHDARCYAASNLLVYVNEQLEKDQAPLSIEDFASEMKADSVKLCEDDCFEIRYDDADLLGGHTIKVKVNADGSFRSLDMEG